MVELCSRHIMEQTDLWALIRSNLLAFYLHEHTALNYIVRHPLFELRPYTVFVSPSCLFITLVCPSILNGVRLVPGSIFETAARVYCPLQQRLCLSHSRYQAHAGSLSGAKLMTADSK